MNKKGRGGNKGLRRGIVATIVSDNFLPVGCPNENETWEALMCESEQKKISCQIFSRTKTGKFEKFCPWKSGERTCQNGATSICGTSWRHLPKAAWLLTGWSWVWMMGKWLWLVRNYATLLRYLLFRETLALLECTAHPSLDVIHACENSIVLLRDQYRWLFLLSLSPFTPSWTCSTPSQMFIPPPYLYTPLLHMET